MIRVVIADDQELVRTGFQLMLEAEDDIEVCEVVGTGDEAVTAARRHRPDVVLMDIRMPGMNGLDATHIITHQPDPPRVVVVTTFDTDEYLRGALLAGASGFLLKDSGRRLLIEAVRAAADGDALVSPSITVRLLDEIAGSLGPASVSHDLSPRELEVVKSIARGQTNEEIAADLFVAVTTIKTHARSISVKLGVRNRVEIAAWAWQHRLVR